MVFNDSSNVDVMIDNPKRALIKMSIPLIVSLLIASLYNLIDAVWLSDLGSDVIAGVGFVTPIYMLLIGFGNGLGSGAAFAISKYLGENNKSKADNASVHSFLFDIVISFIISFLLIISLTSILEMLGAGQTINYAVNYGQIIILGSIFIILSNALYGIFRGEGDTTRPLYAMIISAILDIILDPIFIYTLNLGVRGAAFATVISAFFVVLILIYWLYVKKDTYLKPNLSNFHFKKDILYDISIVGIPASIQLLNNAFFAAVFSAILAFVGTTDSVAVYSIGLRVITVASTPIIAVGTVMVSVVAANYGARRYENIQITHRYAMKISIIISLIILILICIFAGNISSLFFASESDIGIYSELTFFLQVYVLNFPGMAIGVASTYVFQGVGRGITAMFQTIMRETGFTLPFAFIIAVVLGYGVLGAWISMVVGDIVVSLITLIWANIYINKLIAKHD